MQVKKIENRIASQIIQAKHYKKSLGLVWESFGLYDREKIVGVCCYGQPPASIQKYAFTDKIWIYELKRLVIDRGIENGASFLISNSLKMLKHKPCAVVSYADEGAGHCGIVYQATNWIYAGKNKSHDSAYVVDGKVMHPLNIRRMYGVTNPTQWAKENGYEKQEQTFKHRYFCYVGNRSEKKAMEKLFAYESLPYPKKEKTMYEDGIDCSSYTTEQKRNFLHLLN